MLALVLFRKEQTLRVGITLVRYSRDLWGNCSYKWTGLQLKFHRSVNFRIHGALLHTPLGHTRRMIESVATLLVCV